ncbi:DUF1569 domain-containing protein [Aquiflexum sp. LQ15W]|uniref:DUF1569 domain-containing protein n=1 Tax=Cognataquiflexum nitidum TaxID=2922272 RepID=UPI001F134D43|nr:DUF1569 domain-containing protein [Cognataquiflexum nitidum]MCH6199636.1 DUF1569 domain-containing protein [Cognataquiflexum nitidum]
MSKTILSSQAVNELLARTEKLNPDTKANWGLMTATEMLVHCNLAHQGILKAPKSDKSATFRQLMFKFVFFNIRSEFPKLAKGPKRFQTAGNAPDASFEEEKSKFINILSKYPQIDYALEASHPVFGPLTHQQWGIFVWRHVDHHLRQFGV